MKMIRKVGMDVDYGESLFILNLDIFLAGRSLFGISTVFKFGMDFMCNGPEF